MADDDGERIARLEERADDTERRVEALEHDDRADDQQEIDSLRASSDRRTKIVLTLLGAGGGALISELSKLLHIP